MAAYRKQAKQDAYKELIRELGDGRIRTFYILYGEEEFLLESSWLRIRRQCVNEQSSEIDLLIHKLEGYGNRLDLKRLSMDLRTPPFFSEKRLILVQKSGLFSNKAAMNDEAYMDLTELIRTMPESSCLVFWEEKVDSRLKRTQDLLNNADGLIVEFVKQEAGALNQWVRAWLARENLEVEGLACESLIERCEHDMRSLTQELVKLKQYCQYKGRRRIDLSLVNLLCREDRRGTIFNLTDALSKGDSAESLRLLHLLWSNKEPSQMILFMLARHFKQLLCARQWTESECIKGLGIQPFVARRLKEQSRYFTEAMLEALYEACFQSDVNIKSGKMEDKIALEILLAQAGRAARVAQRQKR